MPDSCGFSSPLSKYVKQEYPRKHNQPYIPCILHISVLFLFIPIRAPDCNSSKIRTIPDFYIILLPVFEYFRHSLQYTYTLIIHIRHTRNDGKKPIPNINALTARIIARMLHTLLVTLNALNAHLPTIIFSASSHVSSHFF